MKRFWRQRILALMLLAAGCVPHVPPISGPAPLCLDDMAADSLRQAIGHSLAALQAQKDKPAAVGDVVTREAVVAALNRMGELLDGATTPRELSIAVAREFLLYQPLEATSSSGRGMLLTGYYEPLFDARLERSPPYIHPLYGVPGDLVVKGEGGGQGTVIGRMDRGRLVPYWTRAEIETQGKARGKEIAWLKDPVDVFVLQVQGSGRLRLADGTVLGAHYAGRNGRPYRSIGAYLVARGILDRDSASLPRIRDYLAANPGERETVLHHNESFVFFRLSTQPGATGSLGRPLTAGRSAAADGSCYPPGALALLVSRQPVVSGGQVTGWKPLSRYILLQDSGSAIKGLGRLDLFFGSDADSGIAAGNMKEGGQMGLLFLKRQPPGPRFTQVAMPTCPPPET